MLRRITYYLLSVVFVAGMVACGGKSMTISITTMTMSMPRKPSITTTIPKRKVMRLKAPIPTRLSSRLRRLVQQE